MGTNYEHLTGKTALLSHGSSAKASRGGRSFRRSAGFSSAGPAAATPMLFAIMPVEESQPYQRPAPNGAPAAVGGVGNVRGTDISGRLDPSGHD
jgi:hypothetical protein